MKSLLPLSLLSLLLAYAGLNSVSATVLDPITGVTATSADTAAGDPQFTADNASLQAGASGVLGASDSLADTGIADDGATRFGDWLTMETGGVITYDLGATYNVSDLLIWNYNQIGYTNVGAQSVEILTSSTGLANSFSLVSTVTFDEVTTAAPLGTPAQDASDGPSPQPNDGHATPAQVLAVDLPDTQYVQLVLIDNYGFTGGLTGYNEVNFVGEAVPEPSIFAMLGLGLIGLIVWQRKRATWIS